MQMIQSHKLQCSIAPGGFSNVKLRAPRCILCGSVNFWLRMLGWAAEECGTKQWCDGWVCPSWVGWLEPLFCFVPSKFSWSRLRYCKTFAVQKGRTKWSTALLLALALNSNSYNLGQRKGSQRCLLSLFKYLENDLLSDDCCWYTN